MSSEGEKVKMGSSDFMADREMNTSDANLIHNISTPQLRKKRSSLANIAVPSFVDFKAQTSSYPGQKPLRRKPLPGSALATPSRSPSADLSETSKPRAIDGLQRSLSIDSPSSATRRFQHLPSPPASPPKEEGVIGNNDTQFNNITLLPYPRDTPPESQPDEQVIDYASFSYESETGDTRPIDILLDVPDYYQVQSHDSDSSKFTQIEDAFGSPSNELTTTIWPTEEKSVTNTEAHTRGHHLKSSHDGVLVTTSVIVTEPPKSPAQKLASFFSGWKPPAQSNEASSPSTTFSGSESPIMSPLTLRQFNNGPAPALTTLDISKANASAGVLPIRAQTDQGPVTSPLLHEHVLELERELREVSMELANSIRREMELEDQVDRCKVDSAHPGAEAGRRTSDYYSDSGASSVRYPYGESDTKIEELERLRRKAEQEKAQLKAEMADKLSNELRQRRSLEAQVESLEINLQRKMSEQSNDTEVNNQARQLQVVIDDLRRRLNEEREFKENFQDLLAAIRGELEQNRDERDNLRDEVVPQLRARVDGLEAEASAAQQLSYENARMLRELQQLKEENQILASSHSLPQASEAKSTASIAGTGFSFGLSRAKSPARDATLDRKEPSLSRSNSAREASEGRESLSERLKDVEEQRSALHTALRSLLKRQELQEKEHAKKVKALEAERDKYAMISPRRTAFHKEVSQLRGEVNHLRRRADEAMDQKWHCEKGLGGLRTDLDRARQETSSLRRLLQEHEIFLPQNADGDADRNDSQKGIGDHSRNGSLQILKQSIMDAERERDLALREAESYRNQARTLQKSEMAHLGKEKELVAQLEASAQRMDQLAEQVQEQLTSNTKLRQRLTDAVARGEGEQESSASRITAMQARLRELEDKVMVAQQQSDEVINNHEEEVNQLKEAHNAQLHRAKSGLLSPARIPANASTQHPSASSSFFGSSIFSQRSPKIDTSAKGRSRSIIDESRTLILQKKVEDLEKALAEADSQMHEVVERMNMAQIEVAELQSERDDALRKTRNLQSEILAEREKVKAMMA